MPFYDLRRLRLRRLSLYAELGLKPHTDRQLVWEWLVNNRAPHTDWDRATPAGRPVAAPSTT